MTKAKKKIPLMGPIRTNLEAFGVAILAAVFLKWFCLEAYQIPTSSMQPTLMGDQSAQVFDRILVDKILQTFRDPQRWDITVFRYPLQKNQNYVKRLVGMPGDRLHIAGGNVYQVTENEGRLDYAALRKPDDLQEALWKEVYPARRLVRGESKALTLCWSGSPSNAVREDDEGFTIDLSTSTRKLYFRDTTDGGFINHVWDGYPTAVAMAIRNNTGFGRPPEMVPDARLAATLTPDKQLALVSLQIEVNRVDLDKLTFALTVTDGKGRLEVQVNGKVVTESPEFDVPLAAGSATRLRLAHVDDQMIAWIDGDEVQRLETDAWDCREGCVASNNNQFASGQRVVPQIICKGKGKGQLRIDDVVLERDLHYTRYDSPELIEVPEGHYYMMGDNTLQSIDSRGWTAITVGIAEDGSIVAPDSPGARNVRGNKRAMLLQNAPDRDETPIPIPSEDAIIMIDEYGEILRLQGQPGRNWGIDGNVTFLGADGNEWQARDTTNTAGVSFVPRQDIQGRALMVFYPLRPLSWLFGNNWPNRFGFVR